MHKCLYPRPEAQPAILPIWNSFLCFLGTNSAPGNTPTSSVQKSYVAFVALGEVVTRIFGEIQGSESASAADSPSGGSERQGSMSRGISVDGSSSRVLSSVRGTFLARRCF